MRVDGPLPFHVAKAYGVPGPTRVAPLTPTTPASAPSRVAPEIPPRLQSLVGGRVSGRVDFSAGSTTPTLNDPDTRDSYVLPLYTRSADRVEAAVAVTLGRGIDVTG